MNELVIYLRGLKAKKGIKSDSELSRAIGISQPSMNSVMLGMSIPSDANCVKIAEFAGDDPAQVILLAHASKAPDGTRKYWDKMLKALTAAALCAAICTAPAAAIASTFDSLYIMLNRLRTRFRCLFKPFAVIR